MFSSHKTILLVLIDQLTIVCGEWIWHQRYLDLNKLVNESCCAHGLRIMYDEIELEVFPSQITQP